MKSNNDSPILRRKKGTSNEELATQLADIVTLNIRQMGAKKSNETDGSTVDNIQKINDAINFVSSNFGKGIVWIPEGEFLIAPTTTKRIILKSNVTIQGNGTLKIKNNAGDYKTIFGAETDGTFVENVHFKDFRIDQNPKGNTTCNVTVSNPNSVQYAIGFQNFKNITVQNVKFDNCCGINTVLLSGTGCKFAVVKDCFFSFLRTTGATNYDNSAVYFNCEHHQATGNTFYAPISEKAFGAIESHNGLSVISNNTSEGYSTLCNVVSSSGGQTETRDMNDITVVGNTATKCNRGIQLWSITGKKLSNVIVANNVVSVANKDFAEATSCGITLYHSISGLNGDFENVSILGNVINFQIEDVNRTFSAGEMYGIGLSPRGNLKNITVTDNTITNAPARGIRLGQQGVNTSVNVKIKDNIITNSGICSFLNIGLRNAIRLEATLQNVFVEGNVIYDDNLVFGGYSSIDATTGTMTNVTVKNNNVSAKQGGYLHNINKALGIDEGDPIKTHFSTVFPPTTKLNLNVGDVVINTGTLTAGTSYTGYRVTGVGTTSTLAAGITGSCTNGSNVVTVNDSSNLRVGDTILIAGSGKAPTILQITGNTLLMSSSYSATVVDGAISYFAPVLKGYGQLQA